MKELLEAGVHFGHQTRRWNPKMKQYIYAGRNGIYIIDLHQTLRMLETAYNFVREVAAEGGPVLFVGTKKQAQESIREAAEQCGMYYVCERWLGGMLTNYRTIRERIDRLTALRQMEEDNSILRRPRKEQARLRDEKAKLERVLSGIEHMPSLPRAMFVVDVRQEDIAIREARRLKIPVVAIVDTNGDPDEVDYIIPANDDAIRAIRLITGKMAEAVAEGRAEYESRQAKAAMEAREDAERAAADEQVVVEAGFGGVEQELMGTEEQARPAMEGTPPEPAETLATSEEKKAPEETPAPPSEPEAREDPMSEVELT